MDPNLLNLGLESRLLDLSMKPYRPKEITDLKEEIEGEIRAAELIASVTEVIDYECVQRITHMRLKLDALYISWAQGKLK
ncbi:MAG: hypothetical protein ISS02_00495 [Candidatus Portnoybacteria bacterium]|nr:hypothetical protein [Candidatus Portnoybacteria bacterium]